MNVQFYHTPPESGRPRDKVRLKALGLYVYPDRRRVAVGFDLTPFAERPSLEVAMVNANGEPAGSLNVIETLEANFSLIVHLRDSTPTATYSVQAVVYYVEPGEPREVVHTVSATLDITRPGDQTKQFDID